MVMGVQYTGGVSPGAMQSGAGQQQGIMPGLAALSQGFENLVTELKDVKKRKFVDEMTAKGNWNDQDWMRVMAMAPEFGRMVMAKERNDLEIQMAKTDEERKSYQFQGEVMDMTTRQIGRMGHLLMSIPEQDRDEMAGRIVAPMIQSNDPVMKQVGMNILAFFHDTPDPNAPHNPASGMNPPQASFDNQKLSVAKNMGIKMEQFWDAKEDARKREEDHANKIALENQDHSNKIALENQEHSNAVVLQGEKAEDAMALQSAQTEDAMNLEGQRQGNRIDLLEARIAAELESQENQQQHDFNLEGQRQQNKIDLLEAEANSQPPAAPDFSDQEGMMNWLEAEYEAGRISRQEMYIFMSDLWGTGDPNITVNDPNDPNNGSVIERGGGNDPLNKIVPTAPDVDDGLFHHPPIVQSKDSNDSSTDHNTVNTRKQARAEAQERAANVDLFPGDEGYQTPRDARATENKGAQKLEAHESQGITADAAPTGTNNAVDAKKWAGKNKSAITKALSKEIRKATGRLNTSQLQKKYQSVVKGIEDGSIIARDKGKHIYLIDKASGNLVVMVPK